MKISPNYYLAAFLIWAMFMGVAYVHYTQKKQKVQLELVHNLKKGNCLNVYKEVSEDLGSSYIIHCQGNNCRVCKK